MFDIDKELRAIKAENNTPSEDLRQKTRDMVTRAVKSKQNAKPARKLSLLYYPAAAVVLAVILLVSVFFATPAQAAGYYTIDINPSIIVAVDSNDNVLSVSAKNSDAEELLDGLELKGMQFKEALKTVIMTAENKTYLKENGHLLVAHFGDNEGLSQEELELIVREQLPEAQVKAIAISGCRDDFEKAEKEGKMAGVELLISGAREAGIDDQDIDSVIDKMYGKSNNAGGNSGNSGKSENKADKVTTGNNGGNNGSNNGSNSGSNNGSNSGSNNGNGKGNGDGEKNNGSNGNGKDNDDGKKNDSNKGNDDGKKNDSNKGNDDGKKKIAAMATTRVMTKIMKTGEITTETMASPIIMLRVLKTANT